MTKEQAGEAETWALAANPGLDVERIRRLVREFADVLEVPEKAADLEALLRNRQAPLG